MTLQTSGWKSEAMLLEYVHAWLQMAEDRINRLIAGAQGKLDQFQHVNEAEVSGRRQNQEEPCQTKMSSNVVTNPDNTKSLVST